MIDDFDPDSPIDMIKADLRDRRLKDGTDYAIIHKYGETRVLCHVLWRDYIQEAADRHDIVVHTYYTYE
jgi:hypothetical protein